MRIAVVGTTGSGKTTLASRLALAMDAPCIELDHLNWQPGWRGLHEEDPEAFARHVDLAIAGAQWVCDGNYREVRDRVLARATHLVWLDYSRGVVMARALARSFDRSFFQRELWAGNREGWGKWLDRGHPVRWAWSTWKRRRSEYEALTASDAAAHLTVIRLREPREASMLAARLGLSSD